MTERQKRRAETAAFIKDFDKAVPPPEKSPKRKRRRRKPILNRTADSTDAVRGARMEIIRETMSADMRAWMSAVVPEGKRRFLLLQQDTGVGKTETTLADLDFLVHVSAHGGLADEAHSRAEEMGKAAMRWRARSWGWEEVLERAGIQPEISGISKQGREELINLSFPEADDTPAMAMCAFYDQAERLVNRGYLISDVLCRRCDARGLCKEKGYLSQFARAADADQLFIALPELQLVSDPSYKKWAELVNPEFKKVAVIDDVNAENLAPVRSVSLPQIKRFLNERDNENENADVSPAVEFLSELKTRMGEWKAHKKRGDGAAAAEIATALREIIDGADLYPVVFELARIPITFKVFEDTLEQVFEDTLEEPKTDGLLSARDVLPCGDSARIVDVLEKWIFHKETEEGDVLEREIGELLFGPEAIEGEALLGRLATMDLRLSVLEDLIAGLLDGEVFPPPTLIKMRDCKTARWWRADAIGEQVTILLSCPRAFGAGLITPETAPMVVDPKRGWAAALRADDNGVRLACGDNGDVKLEIALRPELNFERSIASSATSNPAEFKGVLGMGTGLAEVIDDEEFIGGIAFKSSGGKRAAWKSGCRVFQISTARFTNTSFFKKSAGAVTGPGPRLRDAIDLIIKQAEQEQVLVIGRSDLQAESLRAETDRLFSHQNVEFRNYGEIVGLDNFSSFGAVVLFLPTPGPEEIKGRAFRLYRGEYHDLDFETRVDGEISIDGLEPVPMPIYADERVQRLAHDAITADFYQAAMRLRPNLLEGKAVVILSAYPVDGLTNRADTLYFDWEDVKQVQDIRDVRPEPEIEDLLSWGVPISELAAALGVSPRHARRKRPADAKAARDAEVRRRRADGDSHVEIARALEISTKTVSRILNSGG